MYEKKRIIEFNRSFLKAICDLGARDRDVAIKAFNIPVPLMEWLLELTESELNEFMELINVPLFSCLQQDEEKWDLIIEELKKPKLLMNGEKVNLLLGS